MGNRISTIDMGGNVYGIHRTMGMGSFGKVHVIVQKSNLENMYALKVLSKSMIVERGVNTCRHILMERYLLELLRSPLLVNLHSAFQDSRNLYMVLDFMPGGDLKFQTRALGAKLTEEVAQFWAANLVLGLEYIHSKNVVHRDMKPDNVMLDRSGYPRITDFNVSTLMLEKNKYKTMGCAGTHQYLAPEMYRRKSDNAAPPWYGGEVDVWALGVMIYEFLIGETPYSDVSFQNRKNIYEKFSKIKYKNKAGDTVIEYAPKPIDLPEKLSENVRDLLGKIFVQRKHRITLAEMKKHPFFKGMDWVKLANRELIPPFVPEHKANVDQVYALMDSGMVEQPRTYKVTEDEQKLFYGWDWAEAGFETVTKEKRKRNKSKKLKPAAASSGSSDSNSSNPTMPTLEMLAEKEFNSRLEAASAPHPPDS